MTNTFEMDGKTYRTDAETASVLRSAIKSYRDSGSDDTSAVGAIMALGIKAGRIEEIEDEPAPTGNTTTDEWNAWIGRQIDAGTWGVERVERA